MVGISNSSWCTSNNSMCTSFLKVYHTLPQTVKKEFGFYYFNIFLQFIAKSKNLSQLFSNLDEIIYFCRKSLRVYLRIVCPMLTDGQLHTCRTLSVSTEYTFPCMISPMILTTWACKPTNSIRAYLIKRAWKIETVTSICKYITFDDFSTYQ